VVVLLTACGTLLTACSSSSPGTDQIGAPTTSPSTAHDRVIPIPNFALPPKTAGCAGATALPGGATQVPVTVSKVGTQVAVLANVCINGHGPFPFVIDTGASQSVVVSSLVSRLKLPAAGPPQAFEGVGCSGSAEPRQVDAWSVAGLVLSGQTVSGATLPGMGGAGQPDGLLGSDVLSRFGAARIDFDASTITVPGPEGPAPTLPKTVTGPTSVPTPLSLLTGSTSGTVPLTVDSGPGLSEVIAPVHLAGHSAMPFAVDTGSSQSVVSQSVAHNLSLEGMTVLERQTTVCSTITVSLVHSGAWSVDTVPLVAGPIATANLGPVGAAGFVGLLGSDQLVHFGWVVFDYRGARLVLGAS
jgi:predicted aspartyl protease